MIDPIIYTTKPPMDKVPGGWDPGYGLRFSGTDKPNGHYQGPGIYYVDNFLSESDCDRIIEFMKDAPQLEAVSVQGMAPGYNDAIGSQRVTMWNEIFAESLWDLFERYGLNSPMYCHEQTATDWWQGGEKEGWRQCVAVSPMIRYMKYAAGGQHYAHYDAAYIYPDGNYRSLKSIVIYLTTNESGATRFIEDGQGNIPISERKHEDWSREVKDEEVLRSIYLKKGRILVFDHRVCHDVQKYDGAEGDRIIIRGDLIFKH